MVDGSELSIDAVGCVKWMVVGRAMSVDVVVVDGGGD